MDKDEIEKKLSEAWSQKPDPQDDEAKKESWEAFAAQTFPTQKRTFRKQWLAIAATIVVALGIMGSLIWSNSDQGNDNFDVLVENTSAAKKTIHLPDGSLVELQPGSQLLYQNNFAESRNLQLKGTAYFKVKKDKLHPFILSCGETTTTVLGTAFTVQQCVQKGVEVQLFEGSVQMNVANNPKNWILVPGERFVFSNSEIAVQKFNRFQDFNEAPLSEIVAYIQTNYGYDVHVPENYLVKKVTLRINQKEEISVIAHILADMYDWEVRIDSEQKTIRFQ